MPNGRKASKCCLQLASRPEGPCAFSIGGSDTRYQGATFNCVRLRPIAADYATLTPCHPEQAGATGKEQRRAEGSRGYVRRHAASGSSLDNFAPSPATIVRGHAPAPEASRGTPFLILSVMPNGRKASKRCLQLASRPEGHCAFSIGGSDTRYQGATFNCGRLRPITLP